MKFIFSSLLALALFAFTLHADVTVKISNVHVCCGKCVKGVNKAVATVPGVTADPSQDDGTVTLTGPDTATVQKAVDALTDAGFYGTTTDSTIKISSDAGAKNATVSKITLTHVHLCCGSCVKAMNAALATVPGVTTNTATKGATSFDVSGNFNDQDVVVALQKAGFTCKVE